MKDIKTVFDPKVTRSGMTVKQLVLLISHDPSVVGRQQ